MIVPRGQNGLESVVGRCVQVPESVYVLQVRELGIERTSCLFCSCAGFAPRNNLTRDDRCCSTRRQPGRCKPRTGDNGSYARNVQRNQRGLVDVPSANQLDAVIANVADIQREMSAESSL